MKKSREMPNKIKKGLSLYSLQGKRRKEISDRIEKNGSCHHQCLIEHCILSKLSERDISHEKENN